MTLYKNTYIIASLDPFFLDKGAIWFSENLGKIKKGDYVGFSAITWSTNVMPLIQLGLNPVPIDIELDTLNVSSEKFLEVLKKHPIKMLFLTNLLGFCDDIDKITKICKEKNIITR